MKKLMFVVLLSLFMLVGCEEKKYDIVTIWINPTAECCGVVDPMNNLDWLKEWRQISYFNKEKVDYYKIYAEHIYIYKNNTTFEDMIVRKVNMHGTLEWWYVYYCNGDVFTSGIYYNSKDFQDVELDKQYISAECLECELFFSTHSLVDTIAYLWTDDFVR